MTKQSTMMDPLQRNLTANQLSVILRLITTQRLFSYHWINLLTSLVCCLRCRSRKGLKTSKMGRKELHFKDGVAKLDTDLDVLNILATVKLFKSLRHILFSREQRLFLKFQNKDAIMSENASSTDNANLSSSGDEDTINQIAEKNSKGIDCQQKIDLERRLRLFTNYGKEMKNKDWRIIEGILTPNISAKVTHGVEKVQIKKFDQSLQR